MKGGAHPSPFTALAFPDSKKVPIYCWVDRENFPVVKWRSPASNSRPYSDFKHHQATLTIRPWRLSNRIYSAIKRSFFFPFLYHIRTDVGAGCVQLWIRSAEPPGEHRYENCNNHICITFTRRMLAKARGSSPRTNHNLGLT